MSSQNDAPEQQHIPAWKKLGLKLKYAAEKSDSIATNHHEVLNEKKRKRSSDKDASTPDEVVKNLKKQKKEKKKTEAEKIFGSIPNAGGPHSGTSQPLSEDLTSPANQKTPLRAGAARKSVSFTPDTKKTDGDSIKQLYQTWLNSHEAKGSSFDASAYDPALQVITPHIISSPTIQTQSSSSTKKNRKAKRSRKSTTAPQKSNGQGGSEEVFSPVSHQATLDYLFTYHTSDSPWKFSKIRQSHLLRHLFSPGFIPSSYYLIALEAYLSGLQGEGAKTRLRKAARKVQAKESSTEAESRDSDHTGAKDAKEDSAREKPSQTERDLQTKDEKKEEKEKENKEDMTPNLDLNNKPTSTPIPPRQIADLVLRIIGNDDGKEDDDDDETSEMKHEEDENKGQQQIPKSKPSTNKIKPPSEPKNQKQPFTNSTTKTTTNDTTASSQPKPKPQPQSQPYKKRIRKHKARVSTLPSDSDDEDDDEEDDESSG